jgi:hypothetical protein
MIADFGLHRQRVTALPLPKQSLAAVPRWNRRKRLALLDNRRAGGIAPGAFGDAKLTPRVAETMREGEDGGRD